MHRTVNVQNATELFTLFFLGEGKGEPHYKACGILVPWSGIEPISWQWKHEALTIGHQRIIGSAESWPLDHQGVSKLFT